jgi:hypothetical protein
MMDVALVVDGAAKICPIDARTMEKDCLGDIGHVTKSYLRRGRNPEPENDR